MLKRPVGLNPPKPYHQAATVVIPHSTAQKMEAQERAGDLATQSGSDKAGTQVGWPRAMLLTAALSYLEALDP